MTIVADVYQFTVGVDTHAKTHHLAVVDTRTGRVVRDHEFDASRNGIDRAIGWVLRNSEPDQVLAGVECVATYGAGITRGLLGAGVRVVEAKPPKRTSRRNHGKSDLIDARAAAHCVLGLDVDDLPTPRDLDGVHAEMGVLLADRDRLNTTTTRERNALIALLRAHDLGVDARHGVSMKQIKQISGWSQSTVDGRLFTAQRLACSILTNKQAVVVNTRMIRTLVTELVPTVLAKRGVGPISAAKVLYARSGSSRITTEARFAALAGVAPIPASSGNTVRNRLCRGGDRQLNSALHVIARSRMMSDPETQRYVEKRRAQGKTTAEIRRCLKRYIAREIHKHLTPLGL
jgi:transposase